MIRSWALLTLLAAAGCSQIPVGTPAPERLPGGPEPLDLRLAVAPLGVAQAPSEQAKGYAAVEVLDAGDLRAELQAWVRAADCLARVESVQGADRVEQLDQAWGRRDDLLLRVELQRFRSTFDGHNGWWIPNILNWAFWMVPAWFVATEEYTLDFSAEVQVSSVDSNEVLHREQLDVAVQGTFDEFDRGWQFFGFVTPNNDAENWRLIVQALLPAAISRLGERLAEWLRGPLYERLRSAGTQQRMRKTLGLVVGVSRYQDTLHLPPLPYAGDDARAVGRALRESVGLAPRQITTLVGADATLERIEQAIEEIAARARPGDQTVVYFAGYGVRGPGGEPQLVLNHAEGAVELSLARLGELLARIPGETLALIDCSFDGRGRSLARGIRPPGAADADASALAAAMGGAALLAAQPGDAFEAPEHLGGSLFAHHLVAGLAGPADLDQNGEIDPSELEGYIRQRTVAEAAYHGTRQRPILAGQSALHLTVRPDPARGK